MRRKLLFFLLLAAVSLPVFGQDTIYAINPLMSEYSTIRHYQNDIEITFDLEGPWKWFSYTDRSTNTIKYFEIDIVVQDFEICCGKVFFCGSGRHGGCFGWFDIDSIFNLNNGTVHFKEFSAPIYSPYSPGLTDSIASLMKLEVIEHDNMTHLLMTGYGHFGNDAINNKAHVLMEAWINATGEWKLCYTMDYDQIMCYDDIALGDSQLIVVGRNKVGSGTGQHTVLSYDWQSAIAYNHGVLEYAFGIVNPHIHNIYITDITYFSTDFPSYFAYDRLKVVSLHNQDMFATVCGATTSFLGYPSFINVVSLYINPFSNPFMRFGFITPDYHYQSFSYNATVNSLYIITCDLTHIYRIPSPYNVVYEEKAGDLYFFSIDDIPSSPYNVVSASEPLSWQRRLWFYDEAVTGTCDAEGPLVTFDFPLNQNSTTIRQFFYFEELIWDGFTVKPDEDGIMLLCY